MCFSLNTFSQDFTYKIKINNVYDLATAKSITDPIRFKFKTFPLFNDSTNTFVFNSNIDVSKNELTTILNNYGYILLEFKKSNRSQLIKEEKEQ